MSSQAALQQPWFMEEEVAPQPAHPLLDALKNTEYGQITIITPEGLPLHFTGSKPGPHAKMRLYDWSALDDGITRGEVGFADGYIYQKWDSDDLAALVTFTLLNTHALEDILRGRALHVLWLRVREWLRSNSLLGSKQNIMAHYNLGNDFYKLWLDEGMTYSSALFEENTQRTLEEAQAAKYRRVLSKLNASPGDHVLDIGCGWGGFAEAAARDGLKVTAITLSEPQAEYARARLRRGGLADRAKVEVVDYRQVDGQFDHIASIGMFEHVGERYWPTYFNTIKKRLKPSGRAIVQTITLDDEIFEELHGCSGVIEYYIFPGGLAPSRRRFQQAAEKAGLECCEMFGFGMDYARTLSCWLTRFEANLPAVRAQGFDEKFIRLWRFYLSSCIGSFRSERSSVMQAELTHG